MAEENIEQSLNENILNETLKHLKDEYEKFSNENKIILDKHRELKKSFCSVYGVIRLLDMMLNIMNLDIPLDITNQVELLRSYSSDIFERQILEIEQEEEE